MKNIKRLAVVLLAVVMCFTACGIVASADEAFEPKVYLGTTYDDSGNTIKVDISTDKAYGAIEATLKFSGPVTYKNDDTTKFIETQNVAYTDLFKYTEADKTIKFVVVTDKVNEGDTDWATFQFTLGEGTGTVSFDLEGVKVCNVGADKLVPNIEVDAKNIIIDTKPIRSLGAQFRKQDGDKKEALRFGSKITRNREKSSIVVDGETYHAASCGFVAGFDFYIEYKNGTGIDIKDVNFDTKTGAVSSKYVGAIVSQADKCYENALDYMIHTYAITGFYDGDVAKTKTYGGITYKLPEEKISAVPYVVYTKDDKEYHIMFGEIVSKSYDEVVAAAGWN